MYLGYQNGKIKFYTKEPLDKVFYNLDKVEETELEYVLDGEEYVLKDEVWKEKQAQVERERIARLYLTGADVERGIYQAKGMDFEDIVEMVETMQFAQAPQVEGIDVKALKIELKANNFYRGNPYVSAIGQLLGFTEEQLNLFFEDGNYEHLLPKEELTETPVEESNIENLEEV
jgi:hypothetical protein